MPQFRASGAQARDGFSGNPVVGNGFVMCGEDRMAQGSGFPQRSGTAGQAAVRITGTVVAGASFIMLC